MSGLSFQDHYPDDLAVCFGCGRDNAHGHHVRSFWDGEETVARFTPAPHHTAMPGYVYGGLLASLVDCHATGTASAAGYRAEGRPLGSEPRLRYVTGRLEVDYLAPTPLGPELEVRGRVLEVKGRKVIVECEIRAEGKVTVRGRVVAVQMPEHLRRSP